MFKNEYVKKTLTAVLAALMLAGCAVESAPQGDAGKDNKPIVSNEDEPAVGIEPTSPDPLVAAAESGETSLKLVKINAEGPAPVPDSVGDECYEALNRFSFDFYNKVAQENGEESSVMSSLSAHYALGMLLQGTKGETADEIVNALGVSGADAAALAYGIRREFAGLSENSDTVLNIANGIFMADRLDTSSCEPTYIALEDYNAETFTGELSTDAAKEFINSWVSEKTDGMIPKLFDENLDESAILVLINTVLLDAKWQNPFINYGTTPTMDFTKPDGSTAQVEALADERVITHIDAPDATGLIMDYSDGRLTFAAIMPKDPADDELITGMSYEKFSEYIGSAKSELCNMRMPKFSIESSLDLNDIVKEMGMELIFDEDNEDLSGFGVSPRGNIFVSKIFQKAKIDVDEEGTRAAAATVIEAEDCCALIDPPPQVVLDHSFFYCVYDSETLTPLFMGRYSGE